MNCIEIRYSYFSNKPTITINGEELSPYSNLISLFNCSFFENISAIISGFDNEIFDDYEIELFGSLYQYKLLLDVSKQSEFCKGIHLHKIESLYQQDELQNRLSSLCQKNQLLVEKPPMLTIYTALPPHEIPTQKGIKFTDVPNADIGIFSTQAEIVTTIRIPVVIAESVSIQHAGKQIYYTLTKDDLPSFFEYVLLEFFTRPMIAKYMSALQYAKLTAIQDAELNSIKTNKPGYYLGNFPDSLEKGEQFQIEFASFPADYFQIKSHNDSIISYNAHSIFAREGGTTSLLVVNDLDEIIVQKQISVISHHYVEKIRIVPYFEYLKKNETSHVKVILTPPNAEDATQLTWAVSNPNVLQVDANGNITALEDGSATITISGHAASAFIIVEVKPNLKTLRFSQQSIRLKPGQSTVINCDIFPQNAAVEKLVWELDNRTIASINPSRDGNRCMLTASTSYEGSGNIRCYDSATDIGAICNIEVTSKIKPSMAGKVALWSWLIGIFVPFLLPISTIAGIYGLSHDEEENHRKRYIICTIGSILTLLFWFIAQIS